MFRIGVVVKLEIDNHRWWQSNVHPTEYRRCDRSAYDLSDHIFSTYSLLAIHSPSHCSLRSFYFDIVVMMWTQAHHWDCRSHIDCCLWSFWLIFLSCHRRSFAVVRSELLLALAVESFGRVAFATIAPAALMIHTLHDIDVESLLDDSTTTICNLHVRSAVIGVMSPNQCPINMTFFVFVTTLFQIL